MGGSAGKMDKFLSFGGRVFLAMIFILSGVSKLGNISGTVQYMSSAGIPADVAPFLLYGAVFLEVVGALLVATGYKSKIGVYMLLAFLIPTTFIFHGRVGDRVEMVNFLKNLAIIGGLFFILGNGAGKWAIGKD